MPDLSTEPKMMRSQQDKDTPEKLSEDETRASRERKDVDDQSGKDREAAKSGTARYESEQMNAIFEGNRPSEEQASNGSEEGTAEDSANREEGGLADKGRSRLGNV